MFGKNEVLSPDYSDGTSLRIVKSSPFLTIQGEGPYMGHAAVFVRLHGCNLRCTFCDTEFSDPTDPVLPLREIVGAVMTRKQNAKLVVITGGEPMRQNIVPLCVKLHAEGLKVQIETAGTLWLNGIEQVADIVCSPKTPMIHIQAWQHAVAFKYVISSRFVAPDSYIPLTATQPRAMPRKLAAPRPGAPVYLSPMDEYDETQNRLNRRTVAELAIQFDVIAGIQLHKFIEVD